VSVMKMGKGGTGEASDIDDLRTTGDLVSNLPHPRVNKADRQHTHIRICTSSYIIEGTLNNKDEEKETAWGTNNINEGKEREGDFKDHARKFEQGE